MSESNEIERALARLRGHLVATPVIGDLRLPGFELSPNLRIKAEGLQCGGGLWFRGAMHELMTQLGSSKGIVTQGAAREAYAQVCAAVLHRLPVLALVDPEELDLPFGSHELCELQRCATAGEAASTADGIASKRGYVRFASGGRTATDPYRLGLATVGLELAEQLPHDVAQLWVAPFELAEPLEAGLRAGGRSIEVRGVDPGEQPVPEALRAALLTGLRMDSDPLALAALAAAMGQPDGGERSAVLLSS